MKTESRMLAPLASLAFLFGCGTESNRSIAGTLVANRTANFSSWSEPVSLGGTINGPCNDQQAALSQDGLSMHFASNRPEDPSQLCLTTAAGLPINDIWVSHRTCVGAPSECPWGRPEKLGPPVNTPLNDAAPALSRDGHSLFFLSNRTGGFGSSDIWVSWRADTHDDFSWGTPVNLGAGVNAAGFDGGPSYFENEGGRPQLYFNRNPEPVPGGGDIYVSEQAADGSWGPASQVVELSSAASDQRPSVAHSGLDIYFYSNRPGSVRDATDAPSLDIWVATRESVLEGWSVPTNLGSPINTASAEQHPLIFSHGATEELYVARGVSGMGLDLFVSTRTREGNGP